MQKFYYANFCRQSVTLYTSYSNFYRNPIGVFYFLCIFMTPHIVLLGYGQRGAQGITLSQLRLPQALRFLRTHLNSAL